MSVVNIWEWFFYQVVAVHDLKSIYRVPLLLENQGVMQFFVERLKLPVNMANFSLRKWRNLADRRVCVGLIGGDIAAI